MIGRQLQILAALWIGLATLDAQAITLGFSPSNQGAAVGGMVTVGVTISGLTNAGAPSLSTFDLDVGFDPSVLGFHDATFGDPVLGDQLDTYGLGFGVGSVFSTIPTAGSVNLYELSFDSAFDLDTFQSDSFTLATLSFTAIGAGSSALDISINSLGDSTPLPTGPKELNATTIQGSVSVTPAASVPAPGSIALLLVGMPWLVSRRRQRRVSSS